MKKKLLRLIVASSVVLSLLSWLANPANAQAPPFQRLFHNPKGEVDAALQELHASLSGRLPILEGFVEATSEPLDHFERGYYECVAQATSDASGGTSVRVTAKITAWYSDATPAQSGYRVLPSNGRLEMDLLDRLEELLAKRAQGVAPAAHVNTPSSPPANPIPALRSAPTRTALAPPAEPVAPPGDLNSLRQRREEAEKRMKELSGDLRSLEEILHNQAHPDNLAVVRKPGTSVFAKPQSAGPVLFSADAEDEFEILGTEGGWIHVQIAGVSRGWIRRTQLDLPEGLGEGSKRENASDASSGTAFRVIREETHPFTGSWEELRGKTVRIIWVTPASMSSGSSPQAKRNFAKNIFVQAYKEASSAAQPPDGVVVVFDSADGGQVAATISNLAQWQTGNLSEALFWKLCSLDPPELFQDVRNP